MLKGAQNYNKGLTHKFALPSRASEIYTPTTGKSNLFACRRGRSFLMLRRALRYAYDPFRDASEVLLMGQVNPIPEGFHTLTPYLRVRGAAEAIPFYERAL